MSLDTGLRVRRDLGGHPHDEEDVYLLSPVAEQDGRFLRRKSRSKAFASSSFLRLFFAMFCLGSFTVISAYLILP